MRQLIVVNPSELKVGVVNETSGLSDITQVYPLRLESVVLEVVKE